MSSINKDRKLYTRYLEAYSVKRLSLCAWHYTKRCSWCKHVPALHGHQRLSGIWTVLITRDEIQLRNSLWSIYFRSYFKKRAMMPCQMGNRMILTSWSGILDMRPCNTLKSTKTIWKEVLGTYVYSLWAFWKELARDLLIAYTWIVRLAG